MRRVLAVSFRSLLVILLACCLAGIEYVRINDDLTTMFLMDRSHSVESMQEDQDQFIRDATEKMPSDDLVGMIDFARQAYLEQMPMRDGYFVPPGRLPAMANPDRTDIASAIRLAMAMFPHDTAKRIVLMSDGNDNMGDLLTEARRAKADGIPIDIVPLEYERKNEVYFERMIAPTYAEAGEQVPIRMVIRSHKKATGSLSIFHNDQLVELPADYARVELKAGSNTFYMKLPAVAGGTQTYRAMLNFDDDSMDTVSLNNTASAFSFVSGGSPALLISADRSKDAPLVDALLKENVQVVVRTPSELIDFSLLQMMNFSAILLSNIPAATFTDVQQKELASYVRDMGSGLIMLGGPDSFGAGGWIGSPVEEVMPVTFEIKHKRVIPRGALVLITHSCEIPRGNYWGKEMAKKSVDTVSSRDYVGVLAYTYTPGGENWEVPLAPNTNKAAVKAKIDRMQIGDMPDFGRTMQMAYDELTKGRGADAAQKHVIILSDGDASPPSALLLGKYKAASITVSTIGIGWGAHVQDAVMRNIATKTDGRYYAARNPRQLPQIFSKESTVIRRPLIVDEPFQPQLVGSATDLLGGLRTGAGGLPTLGGMVITSPKQDPNVLIPIIRATEDGDDPVLAYWQYGLGKTVAFTSGYWPAWGAEWTPWPRFAKFWAQVVRWTLRQESPANFDTYTHVEGNRGRIVIDALDKDASYLNNLQLRSNMMTPDQETGGLRFKQTGPGHYEAEFDVDKAGQYLANVQVFDGGKSVGTIRTGLSVPFSPEYRDLTPNIALLRQVAEITGGRWLNMPGKEAEVFSHDLPPSVAKRPAWTWVLSWLFLPAFLLDVSIRRLANWLAVSIAVELVILVVMLFGMDMRYSGWGVAGSIIFAELIGWTIRFRSIGVLFHYMTGTATVLAETGDRSAQSLDQLRGASERAREELADAKAGGVRDVRETLEVASGKGARKRFDVGDEAAGGTVEDIGKSLGGAAKAPPPSPKKPGSGDGEDTTSRLLRRKRRTRDDDE